MIADAFIVSMDDVMAKRLDDPKQRDYVVTALMTAFDGVQKKAVPDLEQRVKAVEARVRLMVEDVGIAFVQGTFVVKVAGSSESLMKEFRRGTDWYMPWDEVDEILLAAILVNPPSN